MRSPKLLCIDADMKNLATIRSFVEDTVRSFSCSAEAISDITIAVNEAVTNIIEHGYKHQPEKIEIETDRDKDRIVVYIRDHAPWFDPTTIPAPNLALPLENRSYGGLGIHMMRQLTDEMIYRRNQKGENELVLVKNHACQSTQ